MRSPGHLENLPSKCFLAVRGGPRILTPWFMPTVLGELRDKTTPERRHFHDIFTTFSRHFVYNNLSFQ